MAEEKTMATEEAPKTKSAKEVRKEERESCMREIQAVLEKYECEMTAQMIITEARTIPQVFVIDARS